MTSAAFAHAEARDFETGLLTGAESTLRGPLAEAVAMTVHPGTGPDAAAARDLLRGRIESTLASEGGRNLLVDEGIRPEQRRWALEQVATDPDWTPGTLDEGWESAVVAETFHAAAARPYEARGPGQAVSGDALANTVGQAIGLATENLPPPNETPAARDARLAEGLDHAYYAPDGPAGRIAAKIDEMKRGDADALVSVVPVTVTGDEFGAAVVPVFRIDRADGSTAVVDHEGRTYRDVADWERYNALPSGVMVRNEGLDLARPALVAENTPETVDTFGERALAVGDAVATGVGVGALVALGTIAVVGSGGAATPFILGAAGAAGGYTAARSGAGLIEDHRRGQDVLDWSDPENRSRWIDVAAGTLSIGAIGAGGRAASMLARGEEVGTGLARTAAGLALAADGADLVAAGDQAFQLGQGWGGMTAAERTQGLLGVAFWGGMAAASTRASGADVRDVTSFERMARTAETGTPYPMRAGEGMAPGEIRVGYGLSEAGRPVDVRIETGAGPVDRGLLDLHTATARQVEASGGLRERLAALTGGREVHEPGSAAWEADLEIRKIERETARLERALRDPALDGEGRAAVIDRQRELDQAIVRENDRLLAATADPNGFVAAPRSLADITTQHVASGAATRGLPFGVDPATRPAGTEAASIDYGQLNELGQAQGIRATIDAGMLDTGSSAASSIGPPGYLRGSYNHSRGHLLARMLGGSGADERNLVMLFQDRTNSPVMSDFEQSIYDAVKTGETVNYNVTSIYETGGRPVAVAISARGSDGLTLDITIANRDGTNGLGR